MSFWACVREAADEASSLAARRHAARAGHRGVFQHRSRPPALRRPHFAADQRVDPRALSARHDTDSCAGPDGPGAAHLASPTLRRAISGERGRPLAARHAALDAAPGADRERDVLGAAGRTAGGALPPAHALRGVARERSFAAVRLERRRRPRLRPRHGFQGDDGGRTGHRPAVRSRLPLRLAPRDGAEAVAAVRKPRVHLAGARTPGRHSPTPGIDRPAFRVAGTSAVPGHPGRGAAALPRAPARAGRADLRLRRAGLRRSAGSLLFPMGTAGGNAAWVGGSEPLGVAATAGSGLPGGQLLRSAVAQFQHHSRRDRGDR